ncbi:hypothetical protein [Polaromonas sp.]|uniref:hypothetical protein n=1 Tax=Polaromonas sp. TaxID=1869339 RepID=UPI00326375E5
MEVTVHKQATNWLAVVVSISSVSGIVLALLGYGVALAVQTRFGLPHPLTFSSTLELFNLGCWAVVQILADSFNFSVIWNAVRELWATTWPMTVAVVVFAIVSALTLRLIVVIIRKSRPWLSNLTGRAGSGDGINGFFTRNPRILRTLAILAGSLGLVIGTPLLMAFSLVALVFLCALLALIPSVGLTVGKAYLDDWVIRPTVCMPVLNRDALIAKRAAKPAPSASLKTYAAHCIAIVRAKEEIDRGRVIFATTSAVILFDPRNGDVRRVPLQDATVKVIGEL